jgi:hypothetical protein
MREYVVWQSVSERINARMPVVDAGASSLDLTPEMVEIEYKAFVLMFLFYDTKCSRSREELFTHFVRKTVNGGANSYEKPSLQVKNS